MKRIINDETRAIYLDTLDRDGSKLAVTEAAESEGFNSEGKCCTQANFTSFKAEIVLTISAIEDLKNLKILNGNGEVWGLEERKPKGGDYQVGDTVLLDLKKQTG